MNTLHQINPDGCKSLPFAEEATQTFFDYINGGVGFGVFVVAVIGLVVVIVSRKHGKSIPGLLAGVLIAALAISALPTILPALGVELGCAGDGTIVEGTDSPPPADDEIFNENPEDN